MDTTPSLLAAKSKDSFVTLHLEEKIHI